MNSDGTVVLAAHGCLLYFRPKPKILWILISSDSPLYDIIFNGSSVASITVSKQELWIAGMYVISSAKL